MAFCFAPPIEISRVFQTLGGRTPYPLRNCRFETQRATIRVYCVHFTPESFGAVLKFFGCRSRSFPDTKLAEDATEEILGIMSPDDITDGIERASKLNRNELW
jgi:hypothetical protein